MKIYEFRDELWLPHPRDEIFAFFANAANLEALTPPWVGFAFVTPTPVAMRTGALIDYRLRIHGIPIRWRTEITHWAPPFRFVDRQLRGPYRLWEHEHRFEERDGGTVASDRVRYAVLGGALVNRVLVAPDIARIFAYRRERLQERFPAKSAIN